MPWKIGAIFFLYIEMEDWIEIERNGWNKLFADVGDILALVIHIRNRRPDRIGSNGPKTNLLIYRIISGLFLFLGRSWINSYYFSFFLIQLAKLWWKALFIWKEILFSFHHSFRSLWNYWAIFSLSRPLNNWFYAHTTSQSSN